jgi:phosphoenolpyruvate carboxykinase (ATP)
MPMQPTVYARLLGERLAKHRVHAWLVNTGWTGGPYGVGSRMKIAHTRAMVHAALDGSLSDVAMRQDPVFGFHVPSSCPGVPAEVLDPRGTWKDVAAYDARSTDLAGLFKKNFEQFVSSVSPDVRAAGPR